MRKIIIFIAVALFLIAGSFLIKNNKAISPTIDRQDKKTSVSLCYYYSNKTDRGLYDKVFLHLDIKGENISGEFDNYPAEKDSKVGTFEGTVGPLDQKKMGRTASVWWDSLAEGMQVKEELEIEFGDGSASALYGEMTDRGDGVYVYKNKSELSFGPSLWQVDCERLDEMIKANR